MQWSLSEGAGARRLGEARTRAAIQLLLVQACGEIFHVHGRRLAADAVTGILDVVKSLADHARQAGKDMTLRRQLAAAQAHDKVCPPPLSSMHKSLQAQRHAAQLTSTTLPALCVQFCSALLLHQVTKIVACFERLCKGKGVCKCWSRLRITGGLQTPP